MPAGRFVGAHRRADDDEVGIAHGVAGVQRAPVAKAEFDGAFERFVPARGDDDLAGQILAAHDVCQRRADESDADQRHALEQGGVTHHAAPGSFLPMNCDSASTTARISSSRPMVMRRQFGNP